MTTLEQVVRDAILEDCPTMSEERFAEMVERVVVASKTWHARDAGFSGTSWHPPAPVPENTGDTEPRILRETKVVEEVRESLAAYAHEAWSGWMRYLFSEGTFGKGETFTISKGSVLRWRRQMETPYVKLPESEKQSDRDEADKMLALMELATSSDTWNRMLSAEVARDAAEADRDAALEEVKSLKTVEAYLREQRDEARTDLSAAQERIRELEKINA